MFFAKYILDTLFAVLMFWRLITVKSKNKLSVTACVLSFAGIFALNCVALIPGASRAVLISEAYIIEMIRWLLMALYLFGLQRENVKKSLYLSMYWLIIYNAYSIITRLVSVVHENRSPTADLGVQNGIDGGDPGSFVSVCRY